MNQIKSDDTVIPLCFSWLLVCVLLSPSLTPDFFSSKMTSHESSFPGRDPSPSPLLPANTHSLTACLQTPDLGANPDFHLE